MDLCQNDKCTNYALDYGFLESRHGVCWRLRYMTSNAELMELKEVFTNRRDKALRRDVCDRWQVGLDAIRKEIKRRDQE